MKIRKNSEVRNFEINRWYVTDKEVLELLNNGTCEIFTSRYFERITDYEYINIMSNDYTVRIFTSDCEEVKVIYSKEYDCYINVVVTKEGKTIPVIL